MRTKNKIRIITLIADAIAILAIYLVIVYVIPVKFQYSFGMVGIAIVSVVNGISTYFFVKEVQKEPRKKLPKFLEKYDHRRLNSDLDTDMSRKYSDIFRDLAMERINIFLFDNTGRQSPAFIIPRSRIPNIYIDRRAMSYLNESELNALVLHELGHYVNKKEKRKFQYSWAFVLSLLFSPLSFSVLINFSVPKIMYLIPVGFLLISLIFLLILRLNLNHLQESADKFALMQSGDRESMVSMMEKLVELSKRTFDNPRKLRRVSREMDRRIKKVNMR